MITYEEVQKKAKEKGLVLTCSTFLSGDCACVLTCLSPYTVDELDSVKDVPHLVVTWAKEKYGKFFTCGLIAGFDGHSNIENNNSKYMEGFRICRDIRKKLPTYSQ